ncbi:MAG: hypothetical protein P4L57_05110 [Rhizomicrobium sp.]|nr:hypothetical protein [Rhizomicrobium sp.]
MSQTKFDYNDLVRVKPGISHWFDVPARRTTGPRIGDVASVFAVDTDRLAGARPEFPSGTLYGIEFEDGDAIEVHENDLESAELA